jgi:hypothetical protein
MTIEQILLNWDQLQIIVKNNKKIEVAAIRFFE